MSSVGIDLGSKTIKIVVLRDGQPLARAMGTAGFEQADRARELLDQALAEAGVAREEVAHVTATGMGRDGVALADSTVTDITAAVRGAAHRFPGVATVVEVGAEESRAVKTDGRGRVLDSAVNGKCAAGSGSFTESMARALGMTLEAFARESLKSQNKIEMNAQCTVFAESEVVSLIHRSTDKKDIARAVHDAIAARVGAMVRRVNREWKQGGVVLLGGVANNVGFCKSLAENLGMEGLLIPEAPEFSDALGAALIAEARAARAKQKQAGEAQP